MVYYLFVYSGGKSYDAYVMYYKSDTGLTEDDRKRLETVLEESFGYSLCLYTRDVVAEEGMLLCFLHHYYNLSSDY